MAKNGHLRISFLVEKLSPERRRVIGLAANILTTIMFLLLTIFGTRMAWDEYRYEVTSPGLGSTWPQTVWLPILALAILRPGAGAHAPHLAEGRLMEIAYLLFGAFFVMLFAGVPIAASLGLAGTMAIALGNLGIMAFPTNVYAGIAKYPLLAIPMFVLAGGILRYKAGVAGRLLQFTESIIGRGRGALAVITILVAMIIGGISGSGGPWPAPRRWAASCSRPCCATAIRPGSRPRSPRPPDRPTS